MWVLKNRVGERRERRRETCDVVVRPFAIAPPVVDAAAAGRLVVHFFPRTLADVADHQGAGATARRIVEAEFPRIAQPDVPDLGASSRGEGIVGRYGETR